VNVYGKVAASLKEATGQNGISLAAVNCESNLQRFCTRYGRLRNQYELPVVLLLDPTERLNDRYRGRMVAEELAAYAIASDQGIRHVHHLEAATFHTQMSHKSDPSDLWLVLFCTSDEPLCVDLKPAVKRLAYSARSTAKVGLVNCKQRHQSDGYERWRELEQSCVSEVGDEIPMLIAYRQGSEGDYQGETIPLMLNDNGNSEHAAPLLVLQALEKLLRLSTSSNSPSAKHNSGDISDLSESASEAGPPDEL